MDMNGTRLQAPTAPAWPDDPRTYQISVLSGLLVYGVLALDFDIGPLQIAVTFLAVYVTQAACATAVGSPRVDLRSASISALSLCLLLRSNEVWLAAIGAVLTIASKFVLRVKGKHIFNPTNFGLVALLVITDRVWVSPGQWGSIAFFAFLMACLGGFVAHRALRSDVALTFVTCYIGLLVARSLYLGEPLAIPMHRLQSGALLLFTFFMISDPKTTPDSLAGRVLFGALVAAGAWYIQFRLFRTNGLLWSLAACSPLVPLLDYLLPGRRFEWTDAWNAGFMRWRAFTRSERAATALTVTRERIAP
jgi:Na+-transporting NADH:ubiquinone oxidoreductase subunit NqrB